MELWRRPSPLLVHLFYIYIGGRQSFQVMSWRLCLLCCIFRGEKCSTGEMKPSIWLQPGRSHSKISKISLHSWRLNSECWNSSALNCSYMSHDLAISILVCAHYILVHAPLEYVYKAPCNLSYIIKFLTLQLQVVVLRQTLKVRSWMHSTVTVSGFNTFFLTSM